MIKFKLHRNDGCMQHVSNIWLYMVHLRLIWRDLFLNMNINNQMINKEVMGRLKVVSTGTGTLLVGCGALSY